MMNTNKRRFSLWALLFVIIQVAWSQNIDINGKITDSNKEPLQGVVVSLFCDTIRISQVFTNNNGKFSIRCNYKTNNSQKYALQISCLGYESQLLELQNDLTKDVDLGTISLASSAHQMGEAVVSTSRVSLSNGIIIKVPSKIEKEHSSDAISLLSQMGLADLRVDMFKGTIKTANKEVVIYINNLPASKDEALALHPNEIVRVEYHPNPQGEFTGVDALVNFITRSPENGGLLMGNILQNEEVSGVYNLTYKFYHKKNQVGFSYKASYRNDEQSYTKTSLFTNPLNNSTFIRQETADGIPNRNHKTTLNFFHHYKTDNFYSKLEACLGMSKEPFTHTTSIRTQNDLSQTSLLNQSSSSKDYLPSLEWKMRINWANSQVLSTKFSIAYERNEYYSLSENRLESELYPYYSWTDKINENGYILHNVFNYSKTFKNQGQLNVIVYNDHIWYRDNYMGDAKAKILLYHGWVSPLAGYTWNYKQRFFATFNMGYTYAITKQTNKDKCDEKSLSSEIRLSYNFKKANINISYKSRILNTLFPYVENIEHSIDDIQCRRGNPALKNMKSYAIALNGYIKIPKTVLSWFVSYMPITQMTRWTTLYECGKYVHTAITDGTHHPLFASVGYSVDITKQLQLRGNLGWNYEREVCVTHPQTNSSLDIYAELRYFVGSFTFGAYCYKQCKRYGMVDMFLPTTRYPLAFSAFANYVRPHYSLSVACYNIGNRMHKKSECSTGPLFSQWQNSYNSLEDKRKEFISVKLTFNLRHGNKKIQYEDFELKSNSKSAIMK